MDHPPQFAHRHEVPLEADSVDSPIIYYGEPMTAIHFITEDGRWGRITFERLDSLRVSRGENEPFPPATDDADGFHWVSTISNSAWLRERYEYEKRHYGSAHNFGGNVDEMPEEYFHYVFSFRDQFVLEVGAELDSSSASSWFLTCRVRNGTGKSYLRGYFGNAVETYAGIPSLAEIRAHIDQWLSEVRERRQKMGKS